MAAEDHGLARRMWHQLEPVHAVFWYAPERGRHHDREQFWALFVTNRSRS